MRVSRRVLASFACLLVGVSISAAPRPPAIVCPQDRYFEGQMIVCEMETVPNAEAVVWTVGTKELKRDKVAWSGKPEKRTIRFQAPSGIRVLTTMHIELRFPETYNVRFSIPLQIFPRRPYYLGAHEFDGKDILVWDAKGRVSGALKRLGVPVRAIRSLQELATRESAAVDLLIVATPFTERERQTVEGLGVRRTLYLEGTAPRLAPPSLDLQPDAAGRWPVCLNAGLPSEIIPPTRWGKGRRFAAGPVLTPPKTAQILWALGPCGDGALPYATLEDQGTRRLVASEIDIQNVFDEEPLADWWLVELLRRSFAPAAFDEDAKE